MLTLCYRDCTKTKGTSVGCKCSTELVFGIIVCKVTSNKSQSKYSTCMYAL